MTLTVRQDVTLTPGPRRVIVKLFVPGEDDAVVRSRARALIDRVAHLDDEETGRLLRDTYDRFGDRPRPGRHLPPPLRVPSGARDQHGSDLWKRRSDPVTLMECGRSLPHLCHICAITLCSCPVIVMALTWGSAVLRPVRPR
jgi:hypothetical protein